MLSILNRGFLAGVLTLGFALPAVAQVKVGVILGASGPAASISIPAKNAFAVLPETLGGQPVEYIHLDDASDTASAVRNARKLATEHRVDMVMGTSTVPATAAIADVAAELHLPMLALAPLTPAAAKNAWVFGIPQPVEVMMGAVAEHLKHSGVKTIGYIGFNDSWGDLTLSSLKTYIDDEGIKVVANERYSRLDASVTGQILKILSGNPDAVVIGASGTPAVLPNAALVERGYRGKIYHTHAVINKDFLRVGGKNVEGIYAPTGPVMVAEQLPDTNPIKEVGLEFAQLYEATYGPGSLNAFAAYSYDAYRLADQAVAVAAEKAKPGTPEFRQAVRDALEETNELVGAQAIYSMSPDNHTGVDERSRVLVRVEGGQWKLVK